MRVAPLYVINDYIYFGAAGTNKDLWEVHRSKLDVFNEECLLHDKILDNRTENDCLISRTD